MIWTTVILGSLACYLLKFAGFSVPERILESPAIRRVTSLIPVAFLAALMGMQTFTSTAGVTLDARVAGLVTAFIALLLRAPFLVVVASAAIVAALTRALGWLP